MLKFEHKSKPLISWHDFISRVTLHFLGAVCLIFGALGIGVLGYHELESLPWIDSLLNASMILGGMGPVDPVKTTAGKLFASFYALFSGIIFLVAVGVIFAPLFHRFLHKFHLAENEKHINPD
ncbi:MAG: hypothetical protein P4L35_07475 [Ignavibacteriaceae bacterium]|nr:hypothetical protein [Ignavibacteriaceae bacterium]